MFFDEDDELFGGSPEKKFYDIVFNANKNLVENELANLVKKNAALELLLEEIVGKDKDIEKMVRNFMFQNEDLILKMQNNLYIQFMGNVLTQNE